MSVLQGGLSNQAFQRIDYFDQPGNPESDVQNQGGGYLKGGANYNIDEKSNVFFNAGLISRQPSFSFSIHFTRFKRMFGCLK